jgi:hypothetical protein
MKDFKNKLNLEVNAVWTTLAVQDELRSLFKKPNVWSTVLILAKSLHSNEEPV